MWGESTITRDAEGTMVLWTCSHTGVMFQDSFDWSYVCQGQGENTGLSAKFNFYPTAVNETYEVSGYIK